ncbi:hypothetical protein DFAR_710045 [Desulfarculales bacterium]
MVSSLTASDGLDTVANAVHVRYLVEAERFFKGVAEKLDRR